MSRALFTSASFTRTSIPVFQNLRQTLQLGRAVYSTTRIPKREGKAKEHRTTRITRAKPNIKEDLTVYLHQHQHHHHKPITMSFLLPGLRRGLMLSTPLILSTPLLVHQFRSRQTFRCDGPDPFSKIANDLTSNYTSEARTPIITESGSANPRAIRQVSMGSILGVFCGLGISVFSKPLAVLIGLGVFVLQVRLC